MNRQRKPHGHARHAIVRSSALEGSRRGGPQQARRREVPIARGAGGSGGRRRQNDEVLLADEPPNRFALLKRPAVGRITGGVIDHVLELLPERARIRIPRKADENDARPGHPLGVKVVGRKRHEDVWCSGADACLKRWQRLKEPLLESPDQRSFRVDLGAV